MDREFGVETPQEVTRSNFAGKPLRDKLFVSALELFASAGCRPASNQLRQRIPGEEVPGGKDSFDLKENLARDWGRQKISAEQKSVPDTV